MILWSILSELRLVEENGERVSEYTKYKNQFDEVFKDLEFPFALNNIPN